MFYCGCIVVHVMLIHLTSWYLLHSALTEIQTGSDCVVTGVYDHVGMVVVFSLILLLFNAVYNNYWLRILDYNSYYKCVFATVFVGSPLIHLWHMALYKFVSIDWLIDWLIDWSIDSEQF